MPTHIRPHSHTHTHALACRSSAGKRGKTQIWHSLCSAPAKSPLSQTAPVTMTMHVTVSVGTVDKRRLLRLSLHLPGHPAPTLATHLTKKLGSLSRKIYYYFSALQAVCNFKWILISFELFRF